MADQVEYTDAVPGATEGKNELTQSPRAPYLARMEGRSPEVHSDDFIVRVVRFDTYEQFLRIPLIKEHTEDPRFLTFATRGNGRTILAIYRSGFQMPVGRAKTTVGLETLNSQSATQPTNAPSAPEPAPTTAP